MNTPETSFMPPLTVAKRGTTVCRNNKIYSQQLLQHAVITFGSPHNEVTCPPFKALVEGNRTGEERVIRTDDERRRRSDEYEAATERRKLQQVSAELQRALDKLRQKGKEEAKLRRKLALTQLKLEEEVERRMLTIDGLFGQIHLYQKFAREQCEEQRRLLQKVLERDEAVEKLKGGRAEKALKAKINQEMEALRTENDVLRQQLEEFHSAKAQWEQTCERLRGQNDDNEASSSRMRHVLETDLMRTQEQLQKVTDELIVVRKTLEASDAKMEQVRLFVQMVCQPNFYVVKDKSLEPVDRNRPDPTGYVLVPLTVLLQGYTLLSPSDRRGLIESYQFRVPQ
ncbi:hypothetical protein DQ04_02651080 [Trypanosoma grayi]|uniref:hypothetical protein n=1 Tax=Trypanosoma grayi TaxID=71804 RepID=UPI0004F4987B|nr:hypothetical protein DQ04_02651080 [Trypanosoma grayi]KEG11410.1 hypothetical protein DQ04_02651080 [Trypanosoma grayi]